MILHILGPIAARNYCVVLLVSAHVVRGVTSPLCAVREGSKKTAHPNEAEREARRKSSINLRASSGRWEHRDLTIVCYVPAQLRLRSYGNLVLDATQWNLRSLIDV